MERYLIRGGPSPAQAAELVPSLLSSQPPKMADGSLTASASHTAHTAALSPAAADEQYTKMAQAVATLLSPTITAAVERAVTAGIDQLWRDIREQAGRLTKIEQHVSDLEEEAQSSQAAAQQASQTQHYILEKLDDMENRSCHNIGLPEAYN